MRKRQIYLLVAVGVLVGVLVAVFRREREPSYGGKRLSEWVEERVRAVTMQDEIIGRHGDLSLSASYKMPLEAVQRIGTNALPFLLDWMQYEAPAWKTKSLEAINKVFHRTFIDHRKRRADCAAWAFAILDEKAEPAVPRLAALLRDTRSSSNTVERAQIALCSLGMRLVSADIVLMTNFSDWRFELAVQNALGMGTNASPAVPVLLGLLQHSDATVRGVATNALRRIDPQALKKASAGGVGKAARKSE